MADPREPVEEVEETAETEREIPETEDTEAEPDEEGEVEETEEEADAEGEPAEEVEAHTPAPTRGNRQFGTLRAENRELKERLDRIERERAAPQVDTREAERRAAEEYERIRLSGDPEAISKYLAEQVERRVTSQLNMVVGHVVDSTDRSEFQALCDRNPAVAKLAKKVETTLAEWRRANPGSNPKRTAVAKYLLGEMVMERGSASQTRQQKRADTENRRQTARPGSARSDVRSTGGKRARLSEQEERAKRLDESGQL